MQEKRIGMSQKELASRLGVTPSTLNGYEKGAHKPDSKVLGKVASITGCTVDFLIGMSDSFDEYYKQKNPPEVEDKTPEGIAKWMLDLLVKEETKRLCGFPLFLRFGAGFRWFCVVKSERIKHRNNNKNTCHMSQDMSRKKAGSNSRPFVLC